MVTTGPVLETALQGFARWGAVRRPATGRPPLRKYVQPIAMLTFSLLAGCGTSTSDEPRPVSSSVAPSVTTGGDDAVCDRFFAIVSDFRMSDEQSAAAFADLSRDTEDPALRAAIRRVAEGFAAHDQSVSSAEVQRLCR